MDVDATRRGQPRQQRAADIGGAVDGMLFHQVLALECRPALGDIRHPLGGAPMLLRGTEFHVGRDEGGTVVQLAGGDPAFS